MDIDSKLAAYRLLKKREKQIEKTKKVLYDLAMFPLLAKEKRNLTDPPMPTSQNILLNEDSSESERSDGTLPEDNKQKLVLKNLIRVKYFLYLLLWLSLYIIAVEIEFGIVFFILSLLCFIWFNTRTGPKKTGEVSAYSVFNPNCEAINGTLNAEQFEKELLYGAVSIH